MPERARVKRGQLNNEWKDLQAKGEGVQAGVAERAHGAQIALAMDVINIESGNRVESVTLYSGYGGDCVDSAGYRESIGRCRDVGGVDYPPTLDDCFECTDRQHLSYCVKAR
ncbi:hypothetical protein NPX13_g8651 [Xylaria arbuscula]|uniref:Uncharacterized protein n=1 Tax=Xylaria arbuscula TaxID=114810 RepID=A0A9W8N898_9PEZI|nr:hypothetical protein NPX13_g8651 [Xylaria arbuscula]